MENVTQTSDIERILELLKRGYGFLFRSASRRGHWNEARSTALAAMCVQLRENADSPWFNAVQRWIVNSQIREGDATGSWGEEIWDTAMCVMALKSLEMSSKDPVIDSALQWMGRLFSVNGRGNWHDEPWETSWALMAILACGRVPGHVNVEDAIAWLVRHVDAEGQLISPHYTAYFVMIDVLSNKLRLSDEVRVLLRQTSLRSRSCLIEALRAAAGDRLWTGEAWSNGQILWALSAADAFPVTDAALLDKTICWFDERQTPEGNWSDVEDTASSILGLFYFLRSILRAQEKGTSTQRLEREIEDRLRKAVVTPRLLTRRHLLERDTETGYVSLNITERAFAITLGTSAFLLVGLLGWLADVMQVFQVLYDKFR